MGAARMNTLRLPYLSSVVADAQWVARRTPSWPALPQEPGPVDDLAADTTPSLVAQAAHPGLEALTAPAAPASPSTADMTRRAHGTEPDTAPLEAQTPPRHPPGIEPAARRGRPSRAYVDDVKSTSPQRHPERQVSGDAATPEHPFMGRPPTKPGNTEDGSARRTDATASHGSEASPISTQPTRQPRSQTSSQAPSLFQPPPQRQAPAVPLAAWSVAPAQPPSAGVQGSGLQAHASGGVDTPAVPAWARTPAAPVTPATAEAAPRVVIGTVDVTVQWLAPPGSDRGTAATDAGPRDYSAAVDPGRRYLRRW
jgi:hypothetical protein